MKLRRFRGIGYDGKDKVDDYHYPLFISYLCEMTLRYLRMLNHVIKRSPEQNLTSVQLAKWHNIKNVQLVKNFSQKIKIKFTVWWNILCATYVCLLLARKERISKSLLVKLEIISSDIYINNLVNRHLVDIGKVNRFMLLEEVINIPIVVCERNGVLYVEDGNHRLTARQRKGFLTIRAIKI